MSFSDFVSMLPAIIYSVVGIVLIWFLVELVKTIKKSRQLVEETEKRIIPTLDQVESMAKSLEPTVQKIDPLVEHVSLTVDAANLEIMRVDQILEDVSEITDAASRATNAVETMTTAPLDLVTSLTDTARNAFKPLKASDKSKALGAEKNKELGQLQQENPISELVQEGVAAAGRFVNEKTSEKEDRWKDHLAQMKARLKASKKDFENGPQSAISEYIEESSDLIADQVETAYKTASEFAGAAKEGVEKLTSTPDPEADYFTYKSEKDTND